MSHKPEAKEDPKRPDGVPILDRGDELIGQWQNTVPQFLELWNDLGAICEPENARYTQGRGEDVSAAYGASLWNLGPMRLVIHATRCAHWRPGDLSALCEPDQLRELINKDEAARRERAAKHEQKPDEQQAGRVPDSFLNWLTKRKGLQAGNNL